MGPEWWPAVPMLGERFDARTVIKMNTIGPELAAGLKPWVVCEYLGDRGHLPDGQRRMVFGSHCDAAVTIDSNLGNKPGKRPCVAYVEHGVRMQAVAVPARND